MSPLLSWAVWFALACYGLSMVLALVRLFGGPAAQDRVLALDFMTTIGVLIIVVQSIRHDSVMYLEAALLLGLFGFLGTAALSKFLLRGEIIE